MSSLEERINQLQARITELEARVNELRVSRDRVNGTLNEFLNLQSLSEMVRSTRNPRSVVSALGDLVRKFIEFEDMGVFIFGEAAAGPQPLSPVAPELLRAAQSQHAEGILDWVVSERRPVVVPWTESFGQEAKKLEKNLVMVPLVVADRPLGIALFSTRRRPDDFTPLQLRILHFAASHAAVAIQNAWRLRDITSLKDFLFSLLENAGDVIFSLNKQGRFTYLNPCIEDLGFRKEELEGQPFQTLFKQVDIGKRIQSTLAQGSRQIFELELRTRLSRPQQFTVNLVPLKDEKGEKIGALGIMRNVTEINHLQRKLLESERLAAYTQTVITLNHEINNPLTTVLGNLFLLEKETQQYQDAKLAERLKVIHENSMRIQNVIKKLERIEELRTVSYLGNTKMLDIRGSSDEAP